ncbi:MAG TPA: HAMP domain-containing sensor histidine kinase [Aldersonia sp.]
MRRRLLIALTVFAAVAVFGFAIPLAATLATNRTQQLVLARSGDAERFASLADAEVATGRAGDLAAELARYREVYGENVVVVDTRGAARHNAGVDIGAPDVVRAIEAARRNLPPDPVERLTPWSTPTLLVARPVGTGLQVNGAVVIEASTARARADIARDWWWVAAGAVAAMALFTVLALTLSRWVLRPLAALSDAVAHLAAQLPKPRATAPEASIATRHGGPAEIRAVAESFDAMALAVVDSADAQRQLVADTAHAMRNPLAALSIRLDSLEPEVGADGRATFAGATREVERLTALLDGLLDLAVAESVPEFDPARTSPTEGQACDAVQVVADRFDAWNSAFVDADVTLSVEDGPTHAETAAPADVLAQILDVALSNSCRYAGAGAHTRIAVETVGEFVDVRVSDDGIGVPADELDRLTTRFFRGAAAGGAGTGSGLGLPIFAALTASQHGSTRIERVDPHGLAVIASLPAVRS